MDKYILDLEAYCLKNKISRPIYDTRNVSGFYSSTVTIGEGITGMGTDSDDRGAMNWAARVLLSRIEAKTYEEVIESFENISTNENQNASNGTNSSSNNQFSNTSELIIDNKAIVNPIGYLQEFCQQKKYLLPKFEDAIKTGEDHCPQFTVMCKVSIDDKQLVGEGKGKSSKIAKKNSAVDVVRKIRENIPDPNVEENKKLLEYLSENFSDNSELKVYIEENQENDYCKKLAKIAPIIGCHINYVESNDGKKVMLQLVIQHLSHNNKVITSYGSSDEGLEASKRMAAKNAVLMLQILFNCEK